MLRIILVIVAVTVMSVFGLNGCKKGSSGTQEGQEEIKSAAEYESEAKEQIDKENMAEELEKIEKELEQDISQEQ